MPYRQLLTDAAGKPKPQAQRNFTDPDSYILALRKNVVEPVFGQIKGATGLDRFRLRGLDQVNGEWALMARINKFL